jgi:hypothetical protein
MAVEEQVFKSQRADMDSPWKDILHVYFQEFMVFCFPEIAEKIDWTKAPEFLDKEFLKICKNAKIGSRHADKLIKVHLISGELRLILCHLEIQSYVEDIFPERMFIYRYRTWDIYRLPILSIAVLIDNKPNWRPDCYKQECFGSFIEMHYRVIKLLDYRSKKKELEAMSNPFAIMVLAQLAVLKSKKNPRSRLYLKTSLTRALYKKVKNKEDILNIYSAIDWLITLPQAFEAKYEQIIESIEEEYCVRYITSHVTNIERRGMQRGIEKGIEKGIKKGIEQGVQQGIQKGWAGALLQLLENRFEEVPKDYQEILLQLNEKEIRLLINRVNNANAIAEIFEGY